MLYAERRNQTADFRRRQLTALEEGFFKRLQRRRVA